MRGTGRERHRGGAHRHREGTHLGVMRGSGASDRRCPSRAPSRTAAFLPFPVGVPRPVLAPEGRGTRSPLTAPLPVPAPSGPLPAAHRSAVRRLRLRPKRRAKCREEPGAAARHGARADPAVWALKGFRVGQGLLRFLSVYHQFRFPFLPLTEEVQPAMQSSISNWKKK